DVNRHFICDTGRADYRWMNRGDRVETPMRAIAGGGQAIEWERAIAEFAELLRRDQGRVVLLLGGRVSSEAIGWLLKLVEGRDHVAAMKVPLGDEAPLTGIPGLALRAERAANLHGAMLLGANASWDQAITALDGASVAIVVGAELDDVEATALAGANATVHLATVADPRFRNAALLLPIASVAEEQGVYVNRDGRAQRYLPARGAPGLARPAWWVAAAAWAAMVDGRIAPATAAEAFSRLDAFGGLGYGDLGLTGRVVDAATSGAAR